LGSKEDGNKPRYVGLLPAESLEDITLDRALQYLDLPREVGKDPESGESILATIGPYGPYLKKGSKNFKVRKGADPFTIDIEEALNSIANTKGSGAIKVFEGSGIKIVDGRWGPYITNGKKNASVPKDTDPESLELNDCLSLLEKAPAKKRRTKKSKTKKN
jgi:DNA topoisomerase-1